MRHLYYSLLLLASVSFASVEANAQVTIGANTLPQPFSALELISGGNKGLRLPQMSNTDKTTAFGSDNAVLTATGTVAQGLQIFNTDTQCVETWNGVVWIQQCGPRIVIPPTKGGDTWAGTKWVGAFWKDNQTGERIIASTGNAGQSWSAVVDDPSGVGSWLTLQANGGFDPDLWTDTPDDAENYRVLGSATTVSGTGDILFRIGAKTVNPQTDASYDTGKKPRYATITLTVGSQNFKLFCRQGESADYVFRPTDVATGTFTSARSLAAKFSPYNLTAATLTDASPDVAVAVRGGVFAGYPTQAGAFFQWGTDKSNGNYTNYLRHAYHPVKPTGTPTAGWDSDYPYPASGDTWNEFTGADRLETCPSGWRRPMVGDTTTLHNTQLASGSEMMQSLFSTTFNDESYNNNVVDFRYWGFYADGFFDRRPIVTSVGSSPFANGAVSKDTKEVAYIGLLFTNPATNASLFTPAVGYRDHSDGSLNSAAGYGYYWSSSVGTNEGGWRFGVGNTNASQSYPHRSYGFSVRCVRE